MLHNRSTDMDMDTGLLYLPEEILQETLRFLDKPALFSFAQTCKWGYQKAIPFIWEEVNLVDCRTRHSEIPDITDEHDDTPIIHKLLILAGNEWIASHVHTLTHRCHLPPPAIFYELPRTNFQGRTLSHDVRTLRLLERACNNLTNLHTLRIIFGHWNITRVLFNTLLGINHKSRIRRLWLENCSIAGYSASALNNLDLNGLESLRLRRLSILPWTGCVTKQQVYYRGPSSEWRQDGRGSLYKTTTNANALQEAILHSMVESRETDGFEESKKVWELMFEEANVFNNVVYKSIREGQGANLLESESADQESPAMYSVEQLLDTTHPHFSTSDTDPYPTFTVLLRACAETLTSLNLDWILTRRTDDRAHIQDMRPVYTLFEDLFALRFPCLRAFQLRNAVVTESELPLDLYLLDECSLNSTAPADMCISFMEAHSTLRCLAWPAERFFKWTKGTSPDLLMRVDNIINNLACTLTDLRVDALYSRSGEYMTDNSTSPVETNRRISRRRFISEFAARMQNLECLKLEGGIPRDEKRETLRALHQSPLRKVVLIGVNCPVGNTWGFCGRDVGSLGINEDPNDPDDFGSLEAEDTDEITRLYTTKPEPGDHVQVFEAEYGWPPGPPFIHTIAAYHADTITELKFCGYRGAPLLWDPTTITTPMLSPLRHFHNLRNLILSLWLQTLYEGDHRDEELMSYWLNTRNPSSTALVPISTEEPTGWAKELAEKYEPSRMAARIVTLIGPFLSERAKARHGGLHIRASFCIGAFGGLFDFDVVIGKAANGSDELKSWKGPREELFPERRAEKLQRRRWF